MVSVDGDVGVGPRNLPTWNFQWDGRGGNSPYVSLESFPSDVYTGIQDSFIVLHINICRLPAKFEKLSFLLSELLSLGLEVSAILLCETFLNSGNSMYFQLPGYRFYETHRTNQDGGGVGIYVLERYQVKLRRDLSHFTQNVCESLFCEIQLRGKKVLLGEIYRPPSSLPSIFLDKLESILVKVNALSCAKIIGTDQNIDFLKIREGSNAIPSRLLDLMLTHGLIPSIVKPTRVTDVSHSLIDNLYVSNDLHPITRANVLLTDISDHFPCINYFDLHPTTVTNLSFEYRQYPDDCFLHVSRDMNNHDWVEVSDGGVDNSFEFFTRVLQESMNLHCPLKSVSISGGRVFREKWVNPGLMKESREVQKLYRQVYRLDRAGEPFKEYIRRRNNFNKEKRRCKQRYYTDLLNKSRGDAKQTWKVINAHLGKHKSKETYPQQFIFDNEELTGDGEIADGFNSFFSQIGPSTVASIPAAGIPFGSFLERTPRIPDTIFLTPVTPNEVILLIQGLRNSNSTGLDALPLKLIRNIRNSISVPLSLLINRSFMEGKFPSILKAAVIKPVFKKGSSEDMTNYRPIALLSVISKIIEKAFSNRLKDFLTAVNFLSPCQYGFRQGYSTVDAVGQLVGDVTLGFDESLPSVAVMLDVSKAFDALNHEILLFKLDYAGIRGLALSWLTDYLQNRSQKVKFGRTLSDSLLTNTGVPQGSILGPILFSIFVNDIKSAITYSKVVQYADDTTIYNTGKLPEIVNEMNCDLEALLGWFSANKLLLSSSKTSAILFAKPTFDLTHLRDLQISGCPLKLDSTVKLLGIHLDSELIWSAHVNYVHGKLTSGLYALNRCKNFLSTATLKLMYYGVMHSYILYGVSLWGGTFKYLTNKLLISQNKAVRCIYRKPNTAKADPLFKRGGILKFSDLANIECMKIAYRFSQSQLPPNLASFFTPNNEIHRHGTRGAGHPHFFRYKLQSFRSSFLFRAVSLWNELPHNIRSQPTWNRLISWCRRRYLSEYLD